MAIFHLSVKSVQRSKGRSSTAAAAYRSASRIADERSQKVHDYTRKEGVAFTAVIVPEGETVPDRATLWNAAEAAERRKDGVPAKEVEIALPDELDAAQRQELAETFSRSLAERYGCAVDLCIHEPSKEGDQRNHHAHVMFTTRVFRGGQLAEKIDLELAERDRKKKGLVIRRQEVTELRHHFADLTNKALERAGRPERVDARSFKDQGRAEDDEPTIHKGPAVTAMERRGVMTDRAEENRLTYEIRAEVAKMEAAQKDIELAKAQKAAEKKAAFENATERKAAFERFIEKLEENRPYLGKNELAQFDAFNSYRRQWQRTKLCDRPAFEERVFTEIGEAKEQAQKLQEEQEQKAAQARTAEEQFATLEGAELLPLIEQARNDFGEIDNTFRALLQKQKAAENAEFTSRKAKEAYKETVAQMNFVTKKLKANEIQSKTTALEADHAQKVKDYKEARAKYSAIYNAREAAMKNIEKLQAAYAKSPHAKAIKEQEREKRRAREQARTLTRTRESEWDR